LGTSEHGAWLVQPATEIHAIERRYRGDSLILETVYHTDRGVVSLIDFMPPRDELPNLVRIVVGHCGEVPMRFDLSLRFDYGRLIPWVRRCDHHWIAVAGPDAIRLDAPMELHGEQFHTVGQFTVSAGERLPFSIAWYPSHKPTPTPVDAEEALSTTESFWAEWASHCRYEGPYRDAVLRSLITLKGLIYAPTGGVVAAATTSLPEEFGGTRNWDYRFCWIRDATFVLLAMIRAGFIDEARAWRDWLLRTVAGTPAQLQPLYGLAGERRLTELELNWLPGYENSRPVRIGNAASGQLQIDAYGQILGTMHLAYRHGLAPDKNGWRVQEAMLEHLAGVWREPDESIWEVRGGPRQFTFSKVMAWVAMDRAVKVCREAGDNANIRGPVERWDQLRREIHSEVCRHGFNTRLNAFVQSYDSDELDASLLIIPIVGFLPADDPRMRGTIEAIRQHLESDGFLLRYRPESGVDGLGENEGAFLLCTFWLADNLALLGKTDEARSLFERMLSIRNDVGLLSEQYHPEQRRLLGNFPQAFSHVALVDTAFNLAQGHDPAMT
jgi:GH15 family glucan-1,4-alpha-glucosidase